MLRLEILPMHKKSIQVLLFVGILVPIILFVSKVDYNAVITALQRVGLKFLWIILVTFFAYLLGTLGWWVCLGKERSKISLLSLFAVRQVGETVGLYNPSSVVGGDLLKNQLLKSYQVAGELPAISVVISRITAVLSQLFLLFIALTWLYLTDTHFSRYMHQGLLLIIVLLLLIQVAFFYMLSKKNQSVIKRESLKSNFWKRMLNKVCVFILQSKDFFLQRPRLFWYSYFFYFLHWLVGSIEFYLILNFLDIDIMIIESLLLDMGVILVKSLGAFVPGQIGVEELGNKLVLNSIGLQGMAIWLTVSILRRTRQLFWIGVGILCYLLIRKQRKSYAFKVASYGDSVR